MATVGRALFGDSVGDFLDEAIGSIKTDPVTINPAAAGDSTVGETGSSINNLLQSKTFTNSTGKVENYVSDTQGYQAAKADFDNLNPSNVKIYNKGTSKETIVGNLSNGETVNIHPGTSVNSTPSLEIYDPATKTSIKIRY